MSLIQPHIFQENSMEGCRSLEYLSQLHPRYVSSGQVTLKAEKERTDQPYTQSIRNNSKEMARYIIFLKHYFRISAFKMNIKQQMIRKDNPVMLIWQRQCHTYKKSHFSPCMHSPEKNASSTSLKISLFLRTDQNCICFMPHTYFAISMFQHVYQIITTRNIFSHLDYPFSMSPSSS